MTDLLEAYIALVEALARGDDEAAAFALEVAVETEERHTAAEIEPARADLSGDIRLLLTVRGLERYLWRVQTALRAIDEGFEKLREVMDGAGIL